MNQTQESHLENDHFFSLSIKKIRLISIIKVKSISILEFLCFYSVFFSLIFSKFCYFCQCTDVQHKGQFLKLWHIRARTLCLTLTRVSIKKSAFCHKVTVHKEPKSLSWAIWKCLHVLYYETGLRLYGIYNKGLIMECKCLRKHILAKYIPYFLK